MVRNKSSSRSVLAEAFSLDARGREAEAIPLYRQAIRMGLAGQELRDAMVCLGSSLRTVGQIAAARRILLAARRKFSGDPVVILFLALVEYDAGNLSLAIRQLGYLCTDESRDPGVAKFRKVLHRKFHALRKWK